MEPTRKINRIKSRSAPFRRHWCHRCDRWIIAAGQRCRCGHRDERKRLKKFELRE